MRRKDVRGLCARVGSVLAAVLYLCQGHGAADVVDRSDTGFVVKNGVRIAAAPQRVYNALVKDVGWWWDPAHTFSGDSRNLSIEARLGGCFCERLPGRGGVRHLTVTLWEPGRKLRFSGALGPLQEAGVTGSMTWEMVSTGEETDATLVYSVGGYYPGGIGTLASPVDSVLGAQLRRLKNYVERGTPTP